MNENKKSFGNYFLALLPLIGCFALQIIVALIAEIVAVAAMTSQGMSPDELIDATMALATDSDFLLKTVVAVHITQVILCLILYRTVFKAKPVKPEKPFQATTLPGIFFLAVGLEFVISLCLCGANVLFPEVMENYAELMEQSGLGEMSLLSTIATLILAPIGEEILFRGMTIRILRKATDKFFIINIFQALCFGIAHANIVQGTYAFALGLVLGALVKKYNNIYVSIFAHLGFNVAGTYFISWVTAGSSEAELDPKSMLLVAAIAICCGIISYFLLRRDKIEVAEAPVIEEVQ